MSEMSNLEWVMRSPSLLRPASPEIITHEECLRWFTNGTRAIEALQSDPHPLEEFLRLHRKSGRLGSLFETLLGFWLERLLKVDGLAQGVPIREGRSTVGELDFIFRWPAPDKIAAALSHAEHWEVAVKFFMCIAPTPEQAVRSETFVGQALVDRLDRKLALSMEKQLPLAQDPRAKETLAARGFSGPIASRLFFKGRLFYPMDWSWRKVQAPPEISLNHERGWWLAWSGESALERLRETAERSEAHAPSANRRWVLLGKEHWMGGVEFPEGDGLQALEDPDLLEKLNQHFSVSKNAIQIARVERRSDGTWAEMDGDSGAGRGMILMPGWPESVLRPKVDSR